jgi:hypothetical protein
MVYLMTYHVTPSSLTSNICTIVFWSLLKHFKSRVIRQIMDWTLSYRMWAPTHCWCVEFLPDESVSKFNHSFQTVPNEEGYETRLHWRERELFGPARTKDSRCSNCFTPRCFSQTVRSGPLLTNSDGRKGPVNETGNDLVLSLGSAWTAYNGFPQHQPQLQFNEKWWSESELYSIEAKINDVLDSHVFPGATRVVLILPNTLFEDKD